MGWIKRSERQFRANRAVRMLAIDRSTVSRADKGDRRAEAPFWFKPESRARLECSGVAGGLFLPDVPVPACVDVPAARAGQPQFAN